MFSVLWLSAQNETAVSESLNKNSIYTNIAYGYFGPDLSFGLGLTYDRQILEFGKGYLLARAGWNYWALWGVVANSYHADMALVLFKKSLHLELDFGLNYSVIGDDYDKMLLLEDGKFRPSANAAFRYQKPGEWPLFRIGIGTDGLAFLSFGTSF